VAKRVPGFILLLFSVPAMALAQHTSASRNSFEHPNFGQQRIHGQILSMSAMVFVSFSVELCERSGRVVSRAPVMGSGEFVFDGVPSNYYFLRVLDGAGNILIDQMVDPVARAGAIRIKLPEGTGDKPASGTVSLAELQHKIPRRALKEAEKANKALQKNDLPTLIQHLEKALEIDPEFFAARRNLAKALVVTGQTEKALPVFQKLLQNEPHSVLAYDGLGAVYLTSHHFADAEAAARKALEIDGSNELGHWLLGCSLTARGNADSEALKHLTRIFKRFPRARIIAAGILSRHGQTEEAKKQLQAYLDTGAGGARIEVERALEQMP
jgi:hypothetical protein